MFFDDAHIEIETYNTFHNMLTVRFEPTIIFQKMLTLGFEPITFAMKGSHYDLNFSQKSGFSHEKLFLG